MCVGPLVAVLTMARAPKSPHPVAVPWLLAAEELKTTLAPVAETVAYSRLQSFIAQGCEQKHAGAKNHTPPSSRRTDAGQSKPQQPLLAEDILILRFSSQAIFRWKFFSPSSLGVSVQADVAGDACV